MLIGEFFCVFASGMVLANAQMEWMFNFFQVDSICVFIENICWLDQINTESNRVEVRNKCFQLLFCLYKCVWYWKSTKFISKFVLRILLKPLMFLFLFKQTTWYRDNCWITFRYAKKKQYFSQIVIFVVKKFVLSIRGNILPYQSMLLKDYVDFCQSNFSCVNEILFFR